MSDVALISAALAERLGVTVKPGGLEGEVDGAPTQIRLALVSPNPHGHVAVLDLKSGTLHQAHHQIDLAVDVTMPFRPVLGVGLAAAPAARHAALQSAGRAGFAERFGWKGDEPDRAEALLSADVQQALDQAFVGDPGPAARDSGVTLSWRRSPWPTVDEIEAAVRPLARAWTGITANGRAVRPPTGTEEAMVALAGVALPAGVELRGAPAGLVGAIGGTGVGVTVGPPNAQGLHLRVAVRFASVLPGGPKVVREDRMGWFTRLSEALSGRGEIVLGDGAFDRRFAVRSLRPDLLREVLGPEVREAMLALDKHVPVELGANGVEGHARLPLDRVAPAAQAALALASALA